MTGGRKWAREVSRKGERTKASNTTSIDLCARPDIQNNGSQSQQMQGYKASKNEEKKRKKKHNTYNSVLASLTFFYFSFPRSIGDCVEMFVVCCVCCVCCLPLEQGKASRP